MGVGLRFTKPYRLKSTTDALWVGASYFRSSVHYLADSSRDPHRSRYWINGRVVTHARYQREWRRAWHDAPRPPAITTGYALR